ncbi:MAG: hypothetical protein OT477_00355 [Chloroflexi bacterium]|nr:hypothetical protein [Chloroflexota bacterium]
MKRIQLEEIIAQNRVNTLLFVPFVIYRLTNRPTVNQATLMVTLLDVLPEPEMTTELTLVWEPSSRVASFPVQEKVITELAACGIAAVLLPLYTRYQIWQVTQAGDGFDYWVSDGKQELGLEVSGTLEHNLWQRHRSKIRQYEQARGSVDGYVCVTGFHQKRAILSFQVGSK